MAAPLGERQEKQYQQVEVNGLGGKKVKVDVFIPQTNFLDGRQAIITGGSRGLGRAMVETFARNGAVVTFNSTEGSKAQAEEVIEATREAGREALWVPGDLREASTRSEVLSKTLARVGKLHILVNNAGVNDDDLFIRLNPERWSKVFSIKVDAAVWLTQDSLRPISKERALGSIIFISSVAAHGSVGQAQYAAANSALEGFMRDLSMEYASRETRINAIAPALVDTDLTKGLTSEQIDALLQMTPYKRSFHPLEIANTALFLASDMARGVTGSVINVDGGMRRA